MTEDSTKYVFTQSRNSYKLIFVSSEKSFLNSPLKSILILPLTGFVYRLEEMSQENEEISTVITSAYYLDHGKRHTMG